MKYYAIPVRSDHVESETCLQNGPKVTAFLVEALVCRCEPP